MGVPINRLMIILTRFTHVINEKSAIALPINYEYDANVRIYCFFSEHLELFFSRPDKYHPYLSDGYNQTNKSLSSISGRASNQE